MDLNFESVGNAIMADRGKWGEVRRKGLELGVGVGGKWD
jgi:hypothetical protein